MLSLIEKKINVILIKTQNFLLEIELDWQSVYNSITNNQLTFEFLFQKPKSVSFDGKFDNEIRFF